MSLRYRLTITFLAISVVPLSAVTLFSYFSSERALRQAAEAQADTLSAELGHRMEWITTDLERRMERLWPVPGGQWAAAAPPSQEPPPVAASRPEGQPEQSRTPAAPSATVQTVATMADAMAGHAAVVLGDIAPMLDSLELVPASAMTTSAPGPRAADPPGAGQTRPRPIPQKPTSAGQTAHAGRPTSTVGPVLPPPGSGDSESGVRPAPPERSPDGRRKPPRPADGAFAFKGPGTPQSPNQTRMIIQMSDVIAQTMQRFRRDNPVEGQTDMAVWTKALQDQIRRDLAALPQAEGQNRSGTYFWNAPRAANPLDHRSLPSGGAGAAGRRGSPSRGTDAPRADQGAGGAPAAAASQTSQQERAAQAERLRGLRQEAIARREEAAARARERAQLQGDRAGGRQPSKVEAEEAARLRDRAGEAATPARPPAAPTVVRAAEPSPAVPPVSAVPAAPTAPAVPTVQVGVQPSVAPRVVTPPAPPAQPAAATTPTASVRSVALLQGTTLSSEIQQDGRPIGRINARLNTERLMRTVLTMTRRDRREVPFAIDADGKVHTRHADDRGIVESLNVASSVPSEGLSIRSAGDWVVATRKDRSGLTFGIARPLGDEMHDLRRVSALNFAVGFGLIALVFVASAPLAVGMTRNLHTLMDAVRRLAQGDRGARVSLHSRDEFGQLGLAFNQMAESVAAHERLVVQQERLRRELELCRQIQNDMLPHQPLRLGLTEVMGVSIPAREVGGDFFNYFLLPSGEIALLVGDVSGKGVGAALLMANVQATLRARLPLEQDLSRLADSLDRDLEANTPPEVYLTLFVGILDPRRRVLRYVNAGHNTQFLLRPDRTIERLASTGRPLGLLAGAGYTEISAPLGEGDVLFFYTDGMVEVENEAGDILGADRLESLLMAVPIDDIDALLVRVEDAVRTFRGTAEPSDDATFMALRFAPNVVETRPEPA